MNVLNRLNDYALRVSMGLQNVNKEQFQKAFDVLADAYLNGKKEVFVCGNGGSLTMSDHFHCDHGKGTHFDAKMKPRIQPLTNGSILTAIANDIGYDEVFSFQLGFKAKKGDILVAISASGNSPNIIKAIEKAKELEMTVIAFVGFDGGKAKELADIFLWVRDNNYGIIEDCHQGFMHVLAQAIRTKYNCNWRLNYECSSCDWWFSPIHSGHIQYFNRAKEMGDILVVGVNSDEWLTRKKGRPFMSQDERMRIVGEFKAVDYVIKYNDDDDSSCYAIKQTRELFPDAKIIFANGGDRGKENTLEMNYKDRGELEFAFGVGGSSKLNSSSWILENWTNPKTERPWGYYRVLYETPNTKVKELTVNPGQSLSMQRHEHRNEYWHVVEGVATVNEERQTSSSKHSLYKHHTLNIPCGVWHQLKNETNEPLKIVEIQWGEKCIEEDIERKL